LKHHSKLKLLSVVIAGVFLSACTQPTEQTSTSDKVNLDSQDAKVSYTLGAGAGQSLSANLEMLEGTGIEVDKELLAVGFVDGLKDAGKLDDETMQAVMTEFRDRVTVAMEEVRAAEQAEQAKVAAENIEKGEAFLADKKAQEGIVTLPSGLMYRVITQGTGASPAPTDKVKVHYKGTLIDGTQFDSSYDRGEPATFGVTQVIKGWVEALQLMKVGGKWELFIPADLAYGATARPSIPGNSVLVFDVELLEIVSE